jgi:hypothetical protein
MEILQFPCSRHRLLVNTTQPNAQLNCSTNCLQDNSLAWTKQKTQPLYCCIGMFTALLHSNDRSIDSRENTILLLLQALPSIGCCLQSHSLATVLHATSLPPYGYSSQIAYRRTAISSFPSAVLVTSVISLIFLPMAQFTLQLLPP